MSQHLECALSTDAQFGFLEEDHDLLEQEPEMLQDGQKAFAITNFDGEGMVVVGTLVEIREFIRLMLRGVELEIEKERATDLPVSVRPTWLDGKGF